MAGSGAGVEAALWMPLHPKHELFFRNTLQRFHELVFRAARYDAQAITRSVHRLVMA